MFRYIGAALLITLLLLLLLLLLEYTAVDGVEFMAQL